MKELQSFLRFCGYYRRLICGFSQIAGPLHDLINAYSGARAELSFILDLVINGHQNVKALSCS